MEIVNMIEISDDKKKTGMAIVAAADYLSEFVMEHPVENLLIRLMPFGVSQRSSYGKKRKRVKKMSILSL